MSHDVINITSQQGIDLIKAFEGFSASVYQCPAGYPTIGYGHLVKGNEVFDRPISRSQADTLLRDDVRFAEHAVSRWIRVALTQGQFDSLVSFTFNLGSGALQRSTLRRVINRGHHHEVPRQLKRWVWSGGHKLKGLVRRRHAEALLYQSAFLLS